MGVAVGRGVDLVVALLGVWRAGAAFVPLDVEYPVERLRLMVGDCGPGVVLGDAGGLSWLEGSGVRVLSVGEVEGLGVAAGGGVCVEVGPEELAYVMYTSGSTGRPKGVMVPHGAISNVVQAFQERIGCAPGDTLHAVTSISFDIALLELFWPLAVGARVQLGTPSEAGGPGSAAAPHRVTHFQCTPTLAAAIVEDPAWRLLLRGVKYVLLGGEPVPGHLVHTIQQAFDCEVFNVYGPTEATVWCTARRITGPEDAGLVGGLLANCQAFVVDGVGRLVPPGVRGELWVGGAGLALGYWGRPDLTAERFVSGVVVGAGRLYRTGDVVSLGGDGLFRFHGRVDDQVKVRGHRVELGEVDAALVAHPGVRAGAAVVVGGRLVGCVVPVAGWGGGLVGGVRRFVAGVLPGGSVPGSVVVVEGLPVTVNGKTDRRALAGLVASVVGVEVVGESSAVVGGSVVEVLAGLWRRVLGVAELDWSVGFQQHGGDSLKAIQAAAQARTRGIALTAATLLRADSLAEAARAAAALDPAATGLVRPDRTSSGPLPLLPMQHDFFARPRPDHNWANLAGLFRPDEADPVDEHRLGAALRLVARRHEALRLAFTAPSGGTGEWRQTLVPEPRVAVESRELDCAGADVRTVIEAEARSQQRTIDLVRGPVAKVVVLRVRGEARPRILVIAHHLVMDAWSWQAFLSELACTYAKLTSSPSVDGPLRTTGRRAPSSATGPAPSRRRPRTPVSRTRCGTGNPSA
ncbi:amino acid adenylation domain-containing protein [Kitasatospora acidiphila]|uniref:amino acid adenylation domain-containing protein n=1 Tax=Kitasatospora acidiphila TaxID=2567942 RepID=UPI002B400192|nr:amino acid adenylation domain-containing protein [Kitasatospora acidiphila]